ncbi:hypothetical protein [Lacinutrix undariae]
MKFFPSKNIEFSLIGSYTETLERLQRRTEKSESLTSQYTDKTFRGWIRGNKFRLISSAIGKGAFCMMAGEVNDQKGHVTVTIHKAFKVLLSILLCFPVVGIIIAILTGTETFHSIFIVVVIGQVIFLRYVIIEIAFRVLSKQSLQRLRDVLDVEWDN